MDGRAFGRSHEGELDPLSNTQSEHIRIGINYEYRSMQIEMGEAKHWTMRILWAGQEDHQTGIMEYIVHPR